MAAAAAASPRTAFHDSPLNPRSRFWAVGEGALLAEELYNHTAGLGRHELSGEFERRNLADVAAAQPTKELLARALATRMQQRPQLHADETAQSQN